MLSFFALQAGLAAGPIRAGAEAGSSSRPATVPVGALAAAPEARPAAPNEPAAPVPPAAIAAASAAAESAAAAPPAAPAPAPAPPPPAP
ncbi:MAG TPA: hypothetical protein VEN99_08580, partial [Acidimicrobiia bacterium]|nr:hypothetical protein [Acidimicrobiia bacterium]